MKIDTYIPEAIRNRQDTVEIIKGLILVLFFKGVEERATVEGTKVDKSKATFSQLSYSWLRTSHSSISQFKIKAKARNRQNSHSPSL
jgi:hypothetical protein